MRTAIVLASQAEDVRRRLAADRLVDTTARITKRGGDVLIPLCGPLPPDVAGRGVREGDVAGLPARPAPRDPHDALAEHLRKEGVPPRLAPSKWERLGDVIVLRLPEEAVPHGAGIGRAVGEALGARTVVRDVSGIHGILRTPEIRVLWGDGTETVHTEGRIRYRMDVAKVMFSSGNLAERLSLPGRIPAGSVGVDLFAGIGYFTLPVALRGRPERVVACELNPDSYGFLVDNVRLNRATNVVPLLGDCRDVAPRGVADWVLLGHFDARRYLDVAFECLRDRGLVVYHELCPREQVPEEPVRRLSEAARAAWFEVERTRVRRIKSYAPGIVHVAVEADVLRRPRTVRAGRRTPGS